MYSPSSYSTYVHTPEETYGSSQSSKDNPAVLTVTSVNGVMTESNAQVERGHTGQLNPAHGTDSFAATACNPGGQPVTEILPTTLVTIDGVQAPVSFWMAQGRIQKAADGTLSESAGTPKALPVDTSDVLPLSEAAMAQVNQALESVPQEGLDGLAATGIAMALGTLDPRVMAEKFTQASGFGGAEGAGRLAAMQGVFQAQADAALMSRSGIGAEDLPVLYAWARASARGELQQALHQQLHHHDVSGYKALADRWMSSTPPSVQAMKAAGVPVRNEGREVFLRGTWMSPSAAAKAGFI